MSQSDETTSILLADDFSARVVQQAYSRKGSTNPTKENKILQIVDVKRKLLFNEKNDRSLEVKETSIYPRKYTKLKVPLLFYLAWMAIFTLVAILKFVRFFYRKAASVLKH